MSAVLSLLTASPRMIRVPFTVAFPETHTACVRLALAAGKPVLVEKPIAMCAADAEALTAEAKAKGLFLLEGMWTRFFPAIQKARELLSSGAIGDVISVSADFGWPADPEGEHKRCIDPVSGGVSTDVAMYPIGHILLAAGAAAPSQIVATGTTKPAASESEHNGLAHRDL